ncbi:hypothetical protein RRG08_026088 [Elysia crispata]|uniref:Uncharacterized protein n=1 Tax=Elysia crispata TaxID=231223 RepID=A0AAE1D411_9GAST|nr:hypothetical protein RRG08_026088 [Elysia crispata]
MSEAREIMATETLSVPDHCTEQLTIVKARKTWSGPMFFCLGQVQWTGLSAPELADSLILAFTSRDFHTVTKVLIEIDNKTQCINNVVRSKAHTSPYH